MKKNFMLFLCFVFCVTVTAQTKQQDTVAILIVDRMSDVISSLGSCSFKLTTSNDIRDTASRMIKKFAEYNVYIGGPDKMLVNAHGWKGHRQFMYNGQQLAYYSFDENNYGVLEVPGNIIKMMDSVHDMYDIEFPAADFFYPAFTDDLLQDADTISFLGIDNIGDKEYFHILAVNKDVNFQFWINNDAYNLPAKFAITYKNLPGSPQYLASFSDWEINPLLPDAMFDFQPPPKAAQVRIMSKNDLSNQ